MWKSEGGRSCKLQVGFLPSFPSLCEGLAGFDAWWMIFERL